MTLELFPAARALILLIAANATPVLIARLMQDRWSYPLDCGCTLADGYRLFGAHKTWRGLASGTAAAALAGLPFGLPLWLGAAFGLASLLADALSSAAKRRLRVPPGTEFPGLDQLGEALLPMLVFAAPLSLDVAGMLAATATFITLDISSAPFRRGGNSK